MNNTEYQTYSSDPATLKQIKDALQEMSNAMSQIESWRDFIKDAITKLNSETGVEKKIIRQMATGYHKQSVSAKAEETNAMVELYEKVFNTTV